MDGDDGSALHQWPEDTRPVLRRLTTRTPKQASQIEFHAVDGNFPTGVAHLAIFRAGFVQYRVGVIHMNEQLARALQPGQQLQTPAVAGEGNVSHLASGW